MVPVKKQFRFHSTLVQIYTFKYEDVMVDWQDIHTGKKKKARYKQSNKAMNQNNKKVLRSSKYRHIRLKQLFTKNRDKIA